MKCPYFERRTSSYRYSGIKCKHYRFSKGGYPENWSKEERESHIMKCCNGDFESCSQYQNIKNTWSKGRD